MAATDETRSTAIDVAVFGQSSFAGLGVHKWLVDSLAAMAIRKPTPIQAACVGPILEGVCCHSIPIIWSSSTLEDEVNDYV